MSCAIKARILGRVQGVFFRANTDGSDVERIHEESDRGPNGLAVQVPGEIPPSLALFRRALEFREQHTKEIDDYEQFKREIDEPGGFFWAHWCGDREVEERLQAETKATIRCIPLNGRQEQGKCMITGRPSSQRVLIAKAY